MSKKILITMPWPKSFVSEYDSIIKPLQDRGFDVELDKKIVSLTEADLLERVPGLFAHICGSDPYTESVFEKANDLKFISRIGVGYDTINVKCATEHGVAVLTTPGVGAKTVSEYTFALMLAASRDVCNARDQVRSGNWIKTIGPSLYGKTLGIVGLGNIGKQLAKLVVGFEMKVIAYDPFHDESYAAEHGIRYVEKDELIRSSDYISLHIPFTKENQYFIDAEELHNMKNSAILINAARGGLVRESALYQALKSKEIAFAAFDVFEQEPPKADNPLFELDNFIGTGHNAGTSVEGKNLVVAAAVNNVLAVLDGTAPIKILNPEVLDNKYTGTAEGGIQGVNQ